MAGAGATKHSTVAKSSSSAATKRHNNSHPKPQQQPPSTRRQNLLQLVAVAASATAAAHSFLTTNDLTLHPSQTLTLESNISAVSLSISNLLSLIHHPIAFAIPRPPPPPPSWFHRLISSDSNTDQLFIESFRMSKQSFSYLLTLLTPSLSSSLPIPPNYAVAATLFRLAHAATFNAAGRRFDLDSSTACRVFYVVCKAIIDNLGHFFELRSDLNRIVLGFGWISLPNCCGVLGIDTFGVNGNLFGENGSVMVQALVDSEYRFLDVSAGWPSTMKPELVLRQSELFSAIEESRELLNGPSYELTDGSSIPQYILGESCFPLLPWLITAFRKSDTTDDDDDVEEGDDVNGGCLNMSSSKQAFNSVHNRGMELLDTAFGRLRGRWRILSKEWKEESIESFPYVVVTCCLLHNFLIKFNEEFPDEDSEYTRNHELPDYDGEGDETGERIRSAIASDLSRWEDC